MDGRDHEASVPELHLFAAPAAEVDRPAGGSRRAEARELELVFGRLERGVVKEHRWIEAEHLRREIRLRRAGHLDPPAGGLAAHAERRERQPGMTIRREL